MKTNKFKATLRVLGAVSILATLSGCNSAYELKGEAPGGYNQQVYEIVSNRCYECHANGVAEANFGYIDNVQQMIANNIIDPTNPSNSTLYKKITAPTSGQKMPFGGPYLTKDQTDAVLSWISSLSTNGGGTGGGGGTDPGACVTYTTEELAGVTGTWTEVKNIMETQSNCMNCHRADGDEADTWQIESTIGAGPDYAQMITNSSTTCSSAGPCSPYPGPMVVASNPCQSRLYRRVEKNTNEVPTDFDSINGTESSNWSRMPKSGSVLTTAQRKIIYKWILEGAQNN
jgi:mono/diheme cytochrome c family protein